MSTLTTATAPLRRPTSPRPPTARRRYGLLTVLLVGLAGRVALLPLAHGRDFTVWDLTARGTLAGTDVYAHHPHYPGGPYAYLPLFLYLELPFRWLSLHGAGPFLIWGKVPILAADLLCAVLLAGELRHRRLPERTVVVGTAVFFLNPLVLYNSAYYGRFDTVGVALLLLALRGLRRRQSAGRGWAGPLWYGLAVAAKTFPAFLLPGLWRASRGGRVRLVAAAVAVPVVLTLPYLRHWRAVGHDVLLYDLGRSSQGLSWQQLLIAPLGRHDAVLVGYLLLLSFAGLAVWLGRLADPWLYCATTLVAFVSTSKLVLEQYLLWPLALLVVVAVQPNRRVAPAAWAMLAVLTTFGALYNEDWHRLDRATASVLLAAAGAFFVLVVAVCGARSTAAARSVGSATPAAP